MWYELELISLHTVSRCHLEKHMVKGRSGTSQVHQIILWFLKHSTVLTTQIQKSCTHLLKYKLCCVEMYIRLSVLKLEPHVHLFVSPTLLHLPALDILPVTVTY